MQCGWQVALQVRTTAVGAPSLGPEPATVVVKCRGVPHDLPGSEEAGLTEPYVQDPSFHLLCAVSLGETALRPLVSFLPGL